LRSPWAVAAQLTFLLAVTALPMVDWRRVRRQARP
jgi:hypothetical protein